MAMMIVPIDASATAAANIVKDAVLKLYPGAPHGLTHRDEPNVRPAPPSIRRGAGGEAWAPPPLPTPWAGRQGNPGSRGAVPKLVTRRLYRASATP
jgi:hypothetical protein